MAWSMHVDRPIQKSTKKNRIVDEKNKKSRTQINIRTYIDFKRCDSVRSSLQTNRTYCAYCTSQAVILHFANSARIVYRQFAHYFSLPQNIRTLCEHRQLQVPDVPICSAIDCKFVTNTFAHIKGNLMK